MFYTSIESEIRIPVPIADPSLVCLGYGALAWKSL